MSWFRRRSSPPETSPPSVLSTTVKDVETLTGIARSHLDPDTADRWLAMVKPAVRLVPAAGAEVVIARLGGCPVVPAGFEWPVWEGSGPLSFIGEVDLDALASVDLNPGIDVPTHGRLLAFYFDGSYNNFDSVVGTWDRETLAGARLIHVTEPRTGGQAASTPDGVAQFREQRFSGRQIATYPGWEHHLLRAEFGAESGDSEAWTAHPVQGEAFNEALFALDEGESPRHQIGGWADPAQGPIELEVAQAEIVDDVPFGSPLHIAEASAWHLLLQVDSDDEMIWGDVGSLYWLRRDPDRADSELGQVSFTWQCG